MTLLLAATATALTSMALISWLQPACERWHTDIIALTLRSTGGCSGATLSRRET
jgi:hypothetical protein